MQQPRSIKVRLGLLIGTALLATGAFTLVVYDTVSTIQIHGPLYRQIIDSKDLVGDTLPPPLYIVGSYVATLELLIALPSQRNMLIERFQQLQREFNSKEAEWHARLPPGPLRGKLILSSGQWARRFYDRWNREFLPAVERGDTETMTNLVYGPLTGDFEKHRREILELVALADAQRRQIEGNATSVLRERTYVLGLLGFSLVATIFIVGWLINRHISEPLMSGLRDSEERTRSIIESALDAVVVMDDQGRIIDWNPHAEQIFGWTRETIIGRKLSRTIVPELHREAHDKGLRHFLATGEGKALGKRLEITALRRDGTEFPIELAITPLKLTSGTTFSGFIRDISERKRTEAELRKAKETAEAATLAKSRFLANMSHEIRTPMNGVLGMTELLLTTTLDARQHHLTQTIQQSGEALLAVINDILDFSKIEAGKLTLEQVDFDLQETVESAVELFANAAQCKGLELTCHLLDAVPLALRGDPIRLRQALLNLISNAIKFTQQGEINVRVEAVADTENTVTLRFAVKDTGLGIPAEAQERIFKAFSQADGTTTRRFGGTGLGLTIVKDLVALMKGQVGVDSQPEQGSTFWFTGVFMRQTAATCAPDTEQTLAHKRILVVDDTAANRVILEDHLRAWGALPTLASSAQEAQEHLQTAMDARLPFDLAILDLHMPDTDGFQLARAIRAAPQFTGLRLLMLTSVGYDASPPDAPDIDSWVTKPIRKGLLRQALLGLTHGRPRIALRPAAEQATVTSSWQAETVRILLVEDTPVNREVAAGMLDVLGCRVHAVENGRLAVEAVTQQHFDLILMDCHMPEMDGFTATRAIRMQEAEAANGHHLPIIALTANAMEGDRAHCLAAGMDDYLPKPFTVAQLSALLTRWLPAGQEEDPASSTQAMCADTAAATQDKPISAEIDTTAWDAILSLQRPGRPDILARVLATYLDDSRLLVEQIREAVLSHDPMALYQAAHRLKSSSAQLGAVAMEIHCKELETLGRLARMDEAALLLAQLSQTHQAACSAISTELHHRSAQ